MWLTLFCNLKTKVVYRFLTMDLHLALVLVIQIFKSIAPASREIFSDLAGDRDWEIGVAQTQAKRKSISQNPSETRCPVFLCVAGVVL